MATGHVSELSSRAVTGINAHFFLLHSEYPLKSSLLSSLFRNVESI